MPSAARTSPRPPSVRSVALLADVHGNATALEAVLHSVERAKPELLVHCGDLTWGPQPLETIELSPRSDEELITSATDEGRLRAALAGFEADVVVTAHTHVRYARTVLGRRLLNPGSVGLPYEEVPGAYWALLGPSVEFRRSEYDLDAAAAASRASGDPFAEELVELLAAPPTPAEAVEHAEQLVFSG